MDFGNSLYPLWIEWLDFEDYRDERGVWIARGTFQAREVYRALAAVTAALIEKLKGVERENRD